jgi:hypothetical protein
MKSANCISITGRNGEAQLGQRRVQHPPPAKFSLEALRHLEGAAKLAADVLADHEHIGVAAHFFGQGLADGGDIAEGAAAVADFGVAKAKIGRWLGHGGCCSVHLAGVHAHLGQVMRAA